MFAESQDAFKQALKINKKYTLARKAYDAIKKTREGFTDQVAFRKILAEGEEGSSEGEVTLTKKEMEEDKWVAKQTLEDQKKRQHEKDLKAKEAEKEKKIKEDEKEMVEDLRVPDDKPKKVEGEEAADSEGNTGEADEF
jgi:NADH:ubiquinone oxidoreductase subunit D